MRNGPLTLLEQFHLVGTVPGTIQLLIVGAVLPQFVLWPPGPTPRI